MTLRPGRPRKIHSDPGADVINVHAHKDAPHANPLLPADHRFPQPQPARDPVPARASATARTNPAPIMPWRSYTSLLPATSGSGRFGAQRKPRHYQVAESLAEEFLGHGGETGAVEVQLPPQRTRPRSSAGSPSRTATVSRLCQPDPAMASAPRCRPEPHGPDSRIQVRSRTIARLPPGMPVNRALLQIPGTPLDGTVHDSPRWSIPHSGRRSPMTPLRTGVSYQLCK